MKFSRKSTSKKKKNGRIKIKNLVKVSMFEKV